MPWLCWIDGQECTSREEFVEHMRASHIEGTDFLVCPVCNDVVLDMVTHFGARHQDTPLPMSVPLRVSGAKDFKLNWRRTQRRGKKRFKEGFFRSEKNGKDIHFRSGWEEQVYKILERAFSVKAYQGEPFAIPYFFGGVRRSYWPDVLVEFVDESRMLVEVKPLAQCPTPDGGSENWTQAQNDAKWLAAESYCRMRGWLFVVWTEHAIKHLSRVRIEALTKSELIK